MITNRTLHTVRPAARQDFSALQTFLAGQNYLHRHLDWRDPLEWLGTSPFLVLEENKRILATLACPPDPQEVAWVRLFGVTMNMSADRAWQVLFEQALQTIYEGETRPAIVSLALRDWYGDLLQRNGFVFHQNIVVFVYDEAPPAPPQRQDDLILRDMTIEDLPQVAVLDHLAFESIWRLSSQDLLHAFRKSNYLTVMELNGEIIGYQMSSNTGFYAHLARLAVHPNLQRRRIGYTLVQDLLEHYITRNNCWGVTLNTQHNNTSSLALYQRIGFRETGERFPVYIYP